MTLSLGQPRAPGAAPCEEELPCRFLSHPVTLSRFGGTPEAPDTNLDSILKRDVTLPRKVHLVKAMVFPVVTYGCSTIKKAAISPFSYSKTLVYFFVESSSLTVLCGEQYSGITVSDLFQVVSALLFTQGQTFWRVFKEEIGVH